MAQFAWLECSRQAEVWEPSSLSAPWSLILKDAVAWNSGLTPFASGKRIIWQKDVKLQQAGSLCWRAQMTQIPLEVRAISGAYVAGKGCTLPSSFYFNSIPWKMRKLSLRGDGVWPSSHRQWKQSWDQNLDCLNLDMLSALCSNNTKHSDRMWVITAPTVPNGCWPRAHDWARQLSLGAGHSRPLICPQNLALPQELGPLCSPGCWQLEGWGPLWPAVVMQDSWLGCPEQLRGSWSGYKNGNAVMKSNKAVACDLELSLVVIPHRTVQGTAKSRQGGRRAGNTFPHLWSWLATVLLDLSSFILRLSPHLEVLFSCFKEDLFSAMCQTWR